MGTYQDNSIDEQHSANQSMDHSRIGSKLPQIAIIGGSYSGKSQIFNQLLNRGFQEQSEQGFYDEAQLEIQINNSLVQFQVSDVPDIDGQYKSFLQNCKGFIIVFALNDMDSFNRMVDMYEEIIKNNGKSMRSKIIIIGNKKDLPKEEIQVKKKHIEPFYLKTKVMFQKLSAKNDKELIDSQLKKLVQNIYADAFYQSCQGKILTSSIMNGYSQQDLSQTRVNQKSDPQASNKRNSASFNDDKSNFCDKNCKNCSIF